MSGLGQFWCVTEGNGPALSDARVAYIDDDGSNPNMLGLGSGFDDSLADRSKIAVRYLTTVSTPDDSPAPEIISPLGRRCLKPPAAQVRRAGCTRSDETC